MTPGLHGALYVVREFLGKLLLAVLWVDTIHNAFKLEFDLLEAFVKGRPDVFLLEGLFELIKTVFHLDPKELGG